MTRAEMVSLREYIDVRIAEMDKRFAAIDRSVDLATAGVNQRLEGMNEFRKQLDSQADTFVTRKEVEAKIESIDLRLQVQEKSTANMEGRMWAIGIGATIFASLLSGLVVHFIH
jgi:hypothetical protein